MSTATGVIDSPSEVSKDVVAPEGKVLLNDDAKRGVRVAEYVNHSPTDSLLLDVCSILCSTLIAGRCAHLGLIARFVVVRVRDEDQSLD